MAIKIYPTTLGNTNSVALLTTATVHTNVATKQPLYTVPVGYKAIITYVVLREPTADISGYADNPTFGYSGSANDWLVSIDVSNLALSTQFLGSQFASAQGPPIGAAGAVFGIALNVSSVTGTVIIDVFGYLVVA